MATDPENRPVRVINDDTTEQEMQAGHRIPNADPPKNEAARGGFGNRDGKEGYGSDTAGGETALGVNENADDMSPPKDNMRSDDGGRPHKPNQDSPSNDDLLRPVASKPTGHSIDEMSNPNSHVGMGQMEPKPLNPITNTDTNAELNDPNAKDTAISQ